MCPIKKLMYASIIDKEIIKQEIILKKTPSFSLVNNNTIGLIGKKYKLNGINKKTYIRLLISFFIKKKFNIVIKIKAIISTFIFFMFYIINNYLQSQLHEATMYAVL